MQRRAFVAGGMSLVLSGCGAQSIWAPQTDLDRVRYVHDGLPGFTLITIKNVGSETGAHSALIINARERVMFDPYGIFRHETIPERNDVFFGINPAVLDFIIDFHARRKFFVVTQTKYLPLDVADDLYRRALTAGPVGMAQCTITISALLSNTRGLSPQIRQSLFPNSLLKQVAQLDGVMTREFRDDDEDFDAAQLYRWVPGQPNRYNIE